MIWICMIDEPKREIEILTNEDIPIKGEKAFILSDISETAKLLMSRFLNTVIFISHKCLY